MAEVRRRTRRRLVTFLLMWGLFAVWLAVLGERGARMAVWTAVPLVLVAIYFIAYGIALARVRAIGRGAESRLDAPGVHQWGVDAAGRVHRLLFVVSFLDRSIVPIAYRFGKRKPNASRRTVARL